MLYTGRRGCGKTTTLVKDAYAFSCQGWEIITNMNSLSFADDVLDNEEILGLLETNRNNFVIVIDEIQTFIDSRRSMRKRNTEFAYFLQQIRKRNVIILGTTQFARRVDVAFREHVDIVAKPQYLEEYPVVMVEYYDRTATEDVFFLQDDKPAVVAVLFDPRQVYELFDTEEVITPKMKRVPEESDPDELQETRIAE